MPHEHILKAYQTSKICLFTSRYESGPIAAEEALCLGCTVVGPPDVPSVQDLCEPNFGTLPQSRKMGDMCDRRFENPRDWPVWNSDVEHHLSCSKTSETDLFFHSSLVRPTLAARFMP